MMVNRCHLKKTLLSSRKLKDANLKDHGERFAHEYKSADKENERISHNKGASRQKSAEEKRARVPHKHSCGVEIVNQEADKSANQHARKKRKRTNGSIEGDHGKKRRNHKRNTAGKSVNAVGQIDTVYHTRNKKNGKKIIYRAKLKGSIDKRKGDRGIQSAKAGHKE